MRLVKTITQFVSGTRKMFELYEDAVIVSVEAYTTAYGKHMMKAIVDGRIYTGTFKQEVFDIMTINIGVPGPFVLWNINGKGSKMISIIEDQWQRPEIKFIKRTA
jgi:hypothetical protein